MRIAFDPDKDAINREKHGVSLAFGQRLFDDGRIVILNAARAVDHEDRSKAIGMVAGKLWTAIYVERDQTIRFISVRRSNEPESRGYHRDPR